MHTRIQIVGPTRAGAIAAAATVLMTALAWRLALPPAPPPPPLQSLHWFGSGHRELPEINVFCDHDVAIVHHGNELVFCAGLHADAGLWRIDYARGEATLAYPSDVLMDQFFLPRSDDVAAVASDDRVGVIGADGWLIEPQSLRPDVDGTSLAKFRLAGLAWVGDELHALEVTPVDDSDAALRQGDDYAQRVDTREVVIGRDGAATVPLERRLRGHSRPTRIAHRDAGRWWVLDHVFDGSLTFTWIGVGGGERPGGTVIAAMGPESNRATVEDLAGGSIAAVDETGERHAAFAVEGDRVVARDGRVRARLVWEGAQLRHVESVETARGSDGDTVTERLVTPAGPVEVFWAQQDRKQVVSLGTADNAVATADPDQTHLNLVALPSGDYALTDRDRNYAMLDASLHRRVSPPSPDPWPARVLALARYTPISWLVVLALALRRGRATALPVAAVAPLRLHRLDLSSQWTALVLGAVAFATMFALSWLVRLSPV